jgi:hypothetical protein
MSGNTVDFAAQIAASAPGVSMVGSNTQVKGQSGFLGTALDVLNFGDGSVGQWVVPNTKTRIGGVFGVSQSCTGTAINATTGAPVPVQVTTGDPNIQSQ